MRPRLLRTGVVFGAFLLTGVGTAALGAALPAMLREWHLSDRAAGLLVFSSFAGSTSGVLVAAVRPRLMVTVGMTTTALALLLLSALSHPPLLACFFLYGLGLGIAMTACSLLRSRDVPASETALEMNRLNLVWAAGACTAPLLGLRSLQLVSVRAFFPGLMFAFAASALALLLVDRRYAADPRAGPETAAGHAGRVAAAPRSQRLAPVRMWIFAGAAVGLETALGSWLTAYTQRVTHGTGLAVTANSAFWLGLLFGRAAHSLRAARRVAPELAVSAHIAVVTVALTVLIGVPLKALLPSAAFLAGTGLGPLYPLVLSWALPRFRSSPVFLVAGIASAVLPWLTGVISTACHSLRMGLIAPCAAALVLIAAGLLMRHDIRGSNQVPTQISTIHSPFPATEHKL